MGESNFCNTVRNYLENINSRDDAKKADSYFRSLSANEIIIAGRQCSEFIEKEVKENEWVEAAQLGLSFVNIYYIKVSHNHSNMLSIFDDIAKCDLPVVWRMFLALSLDSPQWQNYLSAQPKQKIFEMLLQIITNSEERMVMRKNTAICTVRFIDTPANESRINMWNAYVKRVLPLLENDSTPEDFRQILLKSLIASEQKSSQTPEIVIETVDRMTINYKKYPQLLWESLALHALLSSCPEKFDVVINGMLTHKEISVVLQKRISAFQKKQCNIVNGKNDIIPFNANK